MERRPGSERPGGAAESTIESGGNMTRAGIEEIMSGNIPKIPGKAEIAERAFQIYERRKHEHGYDISDWVLAEQELNEEFKQAMKSLDVLEPRPEEKTNKQSA